MARSRSSVGGLDPAADGGPWSEHQEAFHLALDSGALKRRLDRTALATIGASSGSDLRPAAIAAITSVDLVETDTGLAEGPSWLRWRPGPSAACRTLATNGVPGMS